MAGSAPALRGSSSCSRRIQAHTALFHPLHALASPFFGNARMLPSRLFRVGRRTSCAGDLQPGSVGRPPAAWHHLPRLHPPGALPVVRRLRREPCTLRSAWRPSPAARPAVQVSTLPPPRPGGEGRAGSSGSAARGPRGRRRLLHGHLPRADPRAPAALSLGWVFSLPHHSPRTFSCVACKQCHTHLDPGLNAFCLDFSSGDTLGQCLPASPSVSQAPGPTAAVVRLSFLRPLTAPWGISLVRAVWSSLETLHNLPVLQRPAQHPLLAAGQEGTLRERDPRPGALARAARAWRSGYSEMVEGFGRCLILLPRKSQAQGSSGASSPHAPRRSPTLSGARTAAPKARVCAQPPRC